jgi:methyl-accepting chemotaxis protein
MTLTWPWAIVIVVAIIMIVGSLGTPATRRHKVQIEELRAKGNEQYRAVADEFAKLAQETREVQSGMKADLEAIRSSVDSIETMMREVG